MDPRDPEDVRPGLARALQQVEGLLSALPGKKAEQARDQLKQIRELLVEQRPPRLAMVGRRGSGKSSLVNALFGEPVALVGHEKPQTGAPKWFRYEGSRGALDLLDTRGFQESQPPAEHDAAQTPLESVLSELERRCPDAILFLIKATEAASGIDEDLRQLKLLRDRLHAAHGTKVPVLAVLTQCDVLEPKGARLHAPDLDDPVDVEEKTARVRRIERQVADAVREVGALKEALVGAIGVSAYMSWRPDGSLRADERWNIDTLVSYLCEKLPKEARLELVRVAQAKKAQREIARALTGLVASACAAVAFTPLPVGDIFPLTSLQASLVAGIGYISGRSMSGKTVAEFLTAMGANVGAGFALREVARAVVKLLPVAGSAVSAAVAFGGTMAIGEAAIAFFIDGLSVEAARARFKSSSAPRAPDEE